MWRDQRADITAPIPDTAIDGVDHVALTVNAGALEAWVDCYTAVFGFHEAHRDGRPIEYAAQRSTLVRSPAGTVRLSIIEPAHGRRSPIADYLRYHDGAGVHHIALRSRDILRTVSTMSGAVNFLWTPSTRVDHLPTHVGDATAEFKLLRHHHIAVYRDAAGVVLQAFTEPVGVRPPLMLEVVERRAITGCGARDITAPTAGIDGV